MSEIKLDQVTFEEDISQITSTNQAVIIEQIASVDNVSTITANGDVKASYTKCLDTCSYFMEGIQEMIGLDNAAAEALNSSDAWIALQINSATEV